jgi:hypothetical protein
MFNYEKTLLTTADPATRLPYRWDVVLADGRRVPWQGCYTGPLTLTNAAVDALCWQLLGIDSTEIGKIATQELQPVASQTDRPSLILHSTTPDLKAFEGDLDKLVNRGIPADYTTYTETRSVYFARAGDLAVGRTSPWQTAVDVEGIDAIAIPGIDYYYLSHALLLLAESHLRSPTVEINRMVEFFRNNGQTVVRLYALEREMQIFLVWLKRWANLEHLYIDANSPDVSHAWNRKSVLYPTIRAALALSELLLDRSPREMLAIESRSSSLYQQLGLTMPILPGYTIERTGADRDTFIEQTIQAAQLLQQRYALQRGCLKAAASGDGARIITDLDLSAESALADLARAAYQHGDDYILEAHVEYLSVNVGGQVLKTTPSAHIRWGQVAEGLTLQITEGTSWKGNIYIDEATADAFGVAPAHYRSITATMQQFLQAFQRQNLGLAIAGIDFAICRIGGVFADDVFVAAQDPNISFNGAECLRVFAEKVRGQHSGTADAPLYATTRVIRPSLECTLPVLRQITDAATEGGTYASAIASIPGRWGMIAIADKTPEAALSKISALYDALIHQHLAI